MEELSNDVKKYLKNKKCNGCYNHCSLLSPNCNKSRIFIKYAIEDYEKEKKVKT